MLHGDFSFIHFLLYRGYIQVSIILHIVYMKYIRELLSIAPTSYIKIKSYTQGTIKMYSSMVNTNGRIQISICILEQ